MPESYFTSQAYLRPTYWSDIVMVRTLDDGMPGFFVLYKPRHDLSVSAPQSRAINLLMKGLPQRLDSLEYQHFD